MATTPSIAMIPSGYQAEKIYSVLPTNGDADLNFSRSGVANRINSDGLIEEMAINVPRLDYSNGTCPSLLLEPQSTNLITYPLSFGNSYWTKTGATVVSGQSAPSVNNPLGAFKLVEDTSTGSHSIATSNITVTALSDYTSTFYVKKLDMKYIAIGISHNATNGAFVQFDLDEGTLVEARSAGLIYTAPTGKIELLSNGWYRISMTSTTTGTFYFPTIFLSKSLMSGSGSPLATEYNYTGDGTSGVYIFGAQIEQQSYATSLMLPATEGSTVTRVAETAGKTGLENYINSVKGTLFVDLKTLGDGTDLLTFGLFGISDFLAVLYRTTPGVVWLQYRTAGVTNTIEKTGITHNIDSKIAISWDVNYLKWYVNGALIYTSSSFNSYSSSILSELLFDNIGSTEPFKGKVKSLKVFKTALSDAELTTLTTI